MTTPRKNFNVLESPYAKHLPQYPSQSEEYLPFELGGSGSCSQNNVLETQNRRYTSTPAKYNNQHNRGINTHRFNDGSSVGGEGNYQNRQNQRGRGNRYFGCRNSFYVDCAGVSEAGQQWQQHPNHQRHSGFGYRRGDSSSAGGTNGQQRFKNNHKVDTAVSYFHFSMLEDPWKDLMERHNAIQNSRIDFQLQQQSSKNYEAKNSSSEAESDVETEKKVDEKQDYKDK